jgi:hypothetical protein
VPACSGAVARFVGTLFSFAQTRDPQLLGNPCSAVQTVDPKRKHLPILKRSEMKDWWDKVQKTRNEVERWALVFCLLSGLRRSSWAARKSYFRRAVRKSQRLQLLRLLRR